MPPPYTTEELGALAGLSPARIDSYAAASLLDPDTDGRFDDYDVLRCQLLRTFPTEMSPEEIAAAIRAGELDHLHTDLMYGLSRDSRTVEQLAVETGLTGEQVTEAQNALGILGAPLDQAAVPVYAGIAQAHALGLPWAAILETLAVFGEATRRIASAATGIFHDHLHAGLAPAPADRELLRLIRESGQQLAPVVRNLVGHTLHQHLLRAMAEDALAHTRSAGGDRPTTVVFVDLALFTALTNVHGDEAATDVLRRFETVVRSVAAQHGGTPVKQIGDAFMLVFGDPAGAASFAVTLHDRAADEENFPALRIGINHGPVITRLGDYFGHVVNVAARMAGAADPGQTWVTEPVAGAARGAGLTVSTLGDRTLRGVREPVCIHIVGDTATRTARDPVCGMLVSHDRATRLHHDDRDLLFCSSECASAYLADPGHYQHLIEADGQTQTGEGERGPVVINNPRGGAADDELPHPPAN